MSNVVNSERIPNNVNLGDDKKLQRALEAWQPKFVDWWKEMGPEGFQEDDIYLRTAISVDHEGWAHFDYVKMPDYRWGIFLADPVKDRKIGFGDFMGQPVWQEIPGEFRNVLRRLVVTQGDTEPASVEQQRLLGHTCPSVYDLRNLFQVNVEEGRHLWAMVYLLQSYFGRDGREEAEGLLERRSGNPDKPRILGAFNEPCSHWLSFFMFTFFTDRDGKYQLLALAESGFDPLSRTTRFMLTEEAHHMFVGETGILRVVQRTCELMKKNKSEDARAEGGIDFPTLQKYLNFWYSVSLDLFGGEISSNAANFFASSLKGRAKEEGYEDHKALEAVYGLDVPVPGANGARPTFKREDVPLRNAMNEVLRDEYVDDSQRGVDKWNRSIAEAGIQFKLTLPSRRFHRAGGIYAGLHFDPEGNPLTKEEWEAQKDKWLPSDADETFVKSLMNKPVFDNKQMANWIAAPPRGIKGKPINFEYVRHDPDLMLRQLTLDELRIEDEASFQHVGIYDELKRRLKKDGYRFRAPKRGEEIAWERAAFLNLTFWGGDGDVLVADRIPADVVVHAGWHHVIAAALGDDAKTADGMLLGEAIASASDLYLVGRLLGHAPDAEFLETQVPAMSDAAAGAGLDEAAFEGMLGEIAGDPERAFEDLRALLFDASVALVDCEGVTEADAVLNRFGGRRFAPLLHHYELSNWILSARSLPAPRRAPVEKVRTIHEQLKAAPDAVAWLTSTFLA